MNKDMFWRFFQDKRILNDEARVKDIIIKSVILIKKVSQDFSNVELVYMYQMLLDMIRGKYRPNYVSIFLIVSGLSYLIYPMDILFDLLPYIGYTDDCALLMAIITVINKELKAYKQFNRDDEIDISDITDLSFSYDQEVMFDDAMFDELMSKVSDFGSNELVASENVVSSQMTSFLEFDPMSVVYLVKSCLGMSNLGYVSIKNLKKLALKGDSLDDVDFMLRHIDNYDNSLEFSYVEKGNYYFKILGDLTVNSFMVKDQSTTYFGDSSLFQTVYYKQSYSFTKSDIYEIIDTINAFNSNKLFNVVVLKFFIYDFDERELCYVNYDSKTGNIDLQEAVYLDSIFSDGLRKLMKGRI